MVFLVFEVTEGVVVSVAVVVEVAEGVVVGEAVVVVVGLIVGIAVTIREGFEVVLVLVVLVVAFDVGVVMLCVLRACLKNSS